MNAWIFLFLSIACSSAINLIFRGFEHYKIERFPAIVVNYAVCFLTGWVMIGSYPIGQFIGSSWFPWLLLLGCFFVLIFYLMALTTARLGISVNAVASKMAMVIPIALALVVLKEQVHFIFYIGLFLALASIYLITVKDEIHLNRHYILLPLGVFIGSGIIDFSLKIIEQKIGDQLSYSHISMTIFLGAFLMGSAISLIRYSQSRFQWSWRNNIAGLSLGVPNFFSIYFLLLALQSFHTQSSLVFGLNNVSIVLLSTFLSVLIFGEQLSIKNKLGLFLAILAIISIAYVGL